MVAKLALTALFTGFGYGFLLLAVREALKALQLQLRGLRVMGVVTARAVADRRRSGLVVYCDHLGRAFVLDPGRYALLCGLPLLGGSVPVVFLRNRPGAARLWTLRHLLMPSFGWFLSAAVTLGTAVVMSP